VLGWKNMCYFGDCAIDISDEESADFDLGLREAMFLKFCH
jgi:hypothetical protein